MANSRHNCTRYLDGMVALIDLEMVFPQDALLSVHLKESSLGRNADNNETISPGDPCCCDLLNQ